MNERVFCEEKVALMVTPLASRIVDVNVNKKPLELSIVSFKQTLTVFTEKCRVMKNYAGARLCPTFSTALGKKEYIFVDYKLPEVDNDNATMSEVPKGELGRAALPVRKGFLQVRPPTAARPATTFTLAEEAWMLDSACPEATPTTTCEAVQFIDLRPLIVNQVPGAGVVLREATEKKMYIPQLYQLYEKTQESATSDEKEAIHVKQSYLTAFVVPREMDINRKTFCLALLCKTSAVEHTPVKRRRD